MFIKLTFDVIWDNVKDTQTTNERSSQKENKLYTMSIEVSPTEDMLRLLILLLSETALREQPYSFGSWCFSTQIQNAY